MSCGENPAPRGTGRFPSAVIEINNPPEISVLRKVVIPVSMGTEENVPPAIGKYFNVILQYEANGHIYLYSSDGIPTAIEANIPQEVLDRIDQLEIDVDLLETGLANETTAREQADTTLQNNITAEATARANADTALNTAITSEATARQTADAGLQSQIDAIVASSDVKDIVGTKAELNNYDTSTLGNNDIIKVLQDESENNATTYYRWNATTQQFTLIGEEGPYYTKSQTDTLLNAKQNTLTAGPNVQIVNDTISATDTTYTAGTGLALNGTQFSVDTTAIATQSDLTAGLATKQDTLTAGANVQINNNTISATDTTYSAFTGTDGQTAGTAGLVPAPATTDAGKFLKADGTWDTAGGGGGDTVYSDKSTSNSATGGAVYIGNLDANQDEQPDPTTTDSHFRYFWALPFNNAQIPQQRSINIFGQNEGMGSISLGVNAIARLDSQVAIGSQTLNNYSATEGVALGHSAWSQAASSVALGARAIATRAGEVNVGNRSGEGFNNTEYRVIGGVHDPVDNHDAATKGYVDTAVAGAGASAFTTNEWNALWA